MAEATNRSGIVIISLLTAGLIFAAGAFMAKGGGLGHRVVSTAKAPQPIGPYSQAVLAGSTLYISGQLGIDPTTQSLAADVKEQTRQCLANLQAILAEAGMDFANVVQVHIYLKDIADFQEVNEIYSGCFRAKAGFPARATMQVAALPKAGKVEIEMIACR